jgi:membrane fusion protein (multidrug efflux system)
VTNRPPNRVNSKVAFAQRTEIDHGVAVAQLPENESSQTHCKENGQCLDAPEWITQPIPLLALAEHHFPTDHDKDQQRQADRVKMERLLPQLDAYVNGHVTFVAPPVGGQISRVLVDDNNRVRKEDLLAEIDKEPYQIAVSQKRAAVDTAKADLQAATAMVRGIEAQARSRRWKLQGAVEDLENQIALLHDRVAALDKSKATLALAQVEFDRARQLLASGTASRQEYDRPQEDLSTASAKVTQALAAVHQVRASLGLPTQPDRGEDLGQVPANLDQTFSSVLHAQADLIQSAAQLGVVHSYEQSPKQMLDEFEKQGDIDRTLAKLTKEAPFVKQAEAKLEVANRELAQAELDLRYCDIVAEIDGVITRRNVNPGNYVQVGQNLMAIRSLDDIWVDANFKETQLGDLRIGQAVDLYVDMYGGRRVFKGRVAGFTMGTGSTLALLPAQNATGNFVTVVLRADWTASGACTSGSTAHPRGATHDGRPCCLLQRPLQRSSSRS